MVRSKTPKMMMALCMLAWGAHVVMGDGDEDVYHLTYGDVIRLEDFDTYRNDNPDDPRFKADDPHYLTIDASSPRDLYEIGFTKNSDNAGNKWIISAPYESQPRALDGEALKKDLPFSLIHQATSATFTSGKIITYRAFKVRVRVGLAYRYDPYRSVLGSKDENQKNHDWKIFSVRLQAGNIDDAPYGTPIKMRHITNDCTLYSVYTDKELYCSGGSRDNNEWVVPSLVTKFVQSCTDSSQCASSLFCSGSVCVARSAFGEYCTENAPCVPGLSCSDGGTCQRSGVISAPNSAPSSCNPTDWTFKVNGEQGKGCGWVADKPAERCLETGAKEACGQICCTMPNDDDTVTITSPTPSSCNPNDWTFKVNGEQGKGCGWVGNEPAERCLLTGAKEACAQSCCTTSDAGSDLSAQGLLTVAAKSLQEVEGASGSGASSLLISTLTLGSIGMSLLLR